jgi:hypothetical protein
MKRNIVIYTVFIILLGRLNHGVYNGMVVSIICDKKVE